MFLFSRDQKKQLSLLPGDAMLVLGDQSQIRLSSNGHQVIHQGGATIVQQGEQLTYTANNAASGALTYNTLKTAIGTQFSLVLPDGTRVWINAGSSVRYPAIFPYNKRQIEVKGEVYMEVQPDKRPFLVITPHETVQVLGTAFNLQAYSEEPFTFTTLVSGKIRIVNNHQTAVTLRPGQQAMVSHQPATTAIRVNQAATEQAMAWKDGYFDFENKKLEDIFRLLSRWYDVQFETDPNTRNLQFSAVIARSSSLKEVLSVLAATGAVKFSKQGNIIRASRQ
jgi:ferric-dicitrate binding protein FerR (iron transport regulator)